MNGNAQEVAGPRWQGRYQARVHGWVGGAGRREGRAKKRHRRNNDVGGTAVHQVKLTGEGAADGAA